MRTGTTLHMRSAVPFLSYADALAFVPQDRLPRYYARLLLQLPRKPEYIAGPGLTSVAVSVSYPVIQVDSYVCSPSFASRHVQLEGCACL